MVWDAEADEKEDLVTCLEGAGLRSRYFKRATKWLTRLV